MDKIILTDKQYQVLLELFNEFNKEFYNFPQDILEAFYDRLYETSKNIGVIKIL